MAAAATHMVGRLICAYSTLHCSIASNGVSIAFTVACSSIITGVATSHFFAVWETGFIVVVYAVNIGTVYPALTRNKALNVALRWREGRVVMEALEEILVVIIGTAKP